MYLQVYGPDGAATHMYDDSKQAYIHDISIVGTSDSFDCDHDVQPEGYYYTMSNLAFSWEGPGWGHTGFIFATFADQTNKAPEFQFPGVMGYHALRGKTILESKW